VADLLWFFVPLVPVLNIVDLQAYAMVSERFVYLPLLGVCAMVARATVPIFARPSLVRAVVAGIGVALLIAYGAITAVHATHFENEERLWTYELSVNPDNHAAVKALESIAWGRGQWKEALAFNVQGYQIALKARESRLAMEFVLQASRRVMLRTPDRDQATLGRLKAAYDDYLETNHFILETAPFRADMKTSAAATRDMSARLDLFRLPRCIVWARTGNLDGAIRQMRAILSEHPSSVEGWSLLTRWLAQQGKWPEAVASVDDMKRHLPDHPASAEVETTLRRAQVLANQRVSTAVERVIRDARVQAILGARQNARQLLDPWVEENPDHFELVVARAQLDTAERSFEAPRRLLERGRDAAASDEKELWERALSELQALENSSDSSRRSDRATRPRGAEEGPKQR
jgi:tetratricopeptide (TPR) repeat protein